MPIIIDDAGDIQSRDTTQEAIPTYSHPLIASRVWNTETGETITPDDWTWGSDFTESVSFSWSDDVDYNWPSTTERSKEYDQFMSELRDSVLNEQKLIFEKKPTTRRTYSNKTYSGVDMTAVMSLPQGIHVFADLQTLSISSHRESFPVRVLGMTAPMGFTSGSRTIGGTLIFSMIEKYPFYNAAESIYGSSSESPWSGTNAGTSPLADSLPPFDITITFNNEYDPYGAALRICGVKIIDDGMVLSVDDLQTENTFSFMAMAIAPVSRAKKWTLGRRNETDVILEPTDLGLG